MRGVHGPVAGRPGVKARAKPAAQETAIYVRVSSKGQDAASQLPDLDRWAKAQGEPFRLFRDTATGTSMDRPAWNKLWKSIEAGAVGTLVVWRLDRLGRTASGLTQLFEDLVRLKVNLVSLKDGMDLATPAGRLMANVLASVAVYETEVRSERQLAGIAAARARGVVFGRPPGTGRPISVGPKVRALVRRLRGEGTNIAAIAGLTKLSRTTVYKILAHEESEWR